MLILASDPMLDTDHWWWEVLAIVAAKVVAIFVIGLVGTMFMRKMGALRKLMPITASTFIVGWLAIAGVPPFAGFWSKDEILLYSLAKSPALYVIGLVTALLTAYYMTGLAVFAAAAFTIVIGVWPQWLLGAADHVTAYAR